MIKIIVSPDSKMIYKRNLLLSSSLASALEIDMFICKVETFLTGGSWKVKSVFEPTKSFLIDPFREEDRIIMTRDHY